MSSVTTNTNKLSANRLTFGEVCGCALSFAIPLASYVRFGVGGAISVGELLLIGYGCINFTRLGFVFQFKRGRRIFILLVSYLVVQIATDIFRDTSGLDSLRGAARISMMTFAFVVLGCLINRDVLKMLLFAMGTAFASIFAYSIGINFSVGHGSYFKFIFGLPVILTCFFICGLIYDKNRILAFSFPAIGGAFAFFANARSLGGITILATACIWMFSLSVMRRRQKNAWKFAAVVGVALSGLLTFWAYTVAAPSGLLGETVRLRYQMQTGGGGEFSLLDGRKELFFSWPKIADSPIVGYGSWPKDPGYVFAKLLQLGEPSLKSRMVVESTAGKIPSHSHIFGAWLEAGIVGALFWMVILAFVGHAIITGRLFYLKSFSPLAFFLLIAFVWDVFFSPPGGERRVAIGFVCWVLVVCSDKRLFDGARFLRPRQIGQVTKLSFPRWEVRGRLRHARRKVSVGDGNSSK